MFLSKPLQTTIINPYRDSVNKKLKDVSCKYRTYVKIKLAKPTTDTPDDQEQEALQSFKSIMEKLWHLDSKLTALAWENEADKPLRQSSTFPASRSSMERFVDRLWVQRSRPAYCRMFIAHDKEAKTIFENQNLTDWLQEMQLSCTIERIQSKQTSKIGHLMGYHATVVNLGLLADAIESQPAMQGLTIEIRSELLTYATEKYANGKDRQLKILQIYSSWSKAHQVRKALIQLYSSSAKGKYPQGVQARFIPNVEDSRFLCAMAFTVAFNNSIKKHYAFMLACETHPSYNITELDYRIEELDVTLRQVIMHIRSTTQNWNLFVAVDKSYNGWYVDFAFRKELQVEAKNMIAALPLFLEKSFGSSKIWAWFTREAREQAANFQWDAERGIIPVNHTTEMGTQLDGWEHLEDLEDETFPDQSSNILHTFHLDLDKQGSNQYGNENSIATNVLAQVVNNASANDDDTDMDSNPPEPDTTNPADTLTATSNTTSSITTTPDKFAFLLDILNEPDKNALAQKLLENDLARETLHLVLEKTNQLTLQSDETTGERGDVS